MNKVEQYVLAFVKREMARPQAVEAGNIIENRPHGMMRDEVRQAIWSLNARGELTLTPDWRIQLPSAGVPTPGETKP